MAIPAIIMLARSGGRRRRPRSSLLRLARARDAQTWLSRTPLRCSFNALAVVPVREAPEGRRHPGRARRPANLTAIAAGGFSKKKIRRRGALCGRDPGRSAATR